MRRYRIWAVILLAKCSRGAGIATNVTTEDESLSGITVNKKIGDEDTTGKDFASQSLQSDIISVDVIASHRAPVMGMMTGKGKGNGEIGKGKGKGEIGKGKGKGEVDKGKGKGDVGKGKGEGGKGKGMGVGKGNGVGKGKGGGKGKGKGGSKGKGMGSKKGKKVRPKDKGTFTPVPSNTTAPGATVAPTRAPTLVPGTTSAPTENPALRFDTTIGFDTMPAQYRPIFTAAATRWDRVIIGDVADRTVTAADRASTRCTLPNVIDDVFICSTVEPIDGVGGIVGSAGPLQVRVNGQVIIPYLGSMRFDTADIEQLQTRGQLQGVIIHEMGHVYGIGTLWNQAGLVSGTPCAYRLNSRASQRYQQLSGCANRAVPLELTGGEGTACAHWDECFQTELMTGTATGTILPLSEVTVATLEDLGYVVNYGAADPFGRNDLAARCRCGNAQLNDAPSSEHVFGTGFGSIDSFGGAHVHERGHLGHRIPATLARDRLGAPKSSISEQEQPGFIALETLPGGKRRKLSDENYAKAFEYGKQILKENKARRDSIELPEDTIYVGDQVVSVLYMQDGEVYTVEVTANDL